MQSKNKKRVGVTVLLMSIFLIIGPVVPGLILYGESESLEGNKKVVLAYAESNENVEEMSEYGRIIDHYGRNVLIETTERGVEELKSQYEINDLTHRNVIRLKNYEFDTEKGLPEVKDKLKIEEYEAETNGLYLVDMIGPVNPEWRETLEEKGIGILNYVPNYAYLVRMTPEQAEEAKGLSFVDWVGIYQPAFKLAEDVEPGMVSVTFSQGMRSIMNVKDEDQLIELANRNDVYYIEQYIEPELQDEMATQTIGGGLWIWDPEDDPDSAYRGHGDYGSLATQLGYDGNGTVVAVADTGLGDGTTPDAGHPDFEDRVLGGYDYENNSYDEGEWNDVDTHGTHVTGSIAGHTHNGTGKTEYEDYYAAEGTAPGSGLYAVKVFDDNGDWVAGDDYHEIVEIPKQAEGETYVHSNSWGSDTQGEYTLSDEDFDRAVRDADRDSAGNQPVVITVAAGNEGPEANSVSSPGNAKNVITVGSTGNYPYNSPEAVSSFSSRGWTDDNRVKPDVMAPGEYIYSTGTDGDYQPKQGTSVANPAVAGAAASIVDWYNSNYGTKPKPSMVKALMINTAYDLANEQEDTGENSPYIPNQDEGWGMVNLPNIVNTDVNMKLHNEESLLETGEVHEYEIAQDDGKEPLRITLTWTDAAAEGDDGPGPGPPITLSESLLKNDLNLEVESPSGEIYRGNNLVESWSVTGENTYDTFDTKDDGWDDVNNVENVYLLPEDVEPGTYTVRVIGSDVPSDANNDGIANQDYSLVHWNAVESEPGPLPPNDPAPGDGEIGVTTNINLSAHVEHQEEKNMNISFYDASDDSLIGEDNIVQSGNRANVTWKGLDNRTKYSWYVVADDGNQTATSQIWNFTTEGENYTITIDSTEGGKVVEPGEDTYEYEPGMIVDLEARSDDISHFSKWTDDNETIDDPSANKTTIGMLGNYTITANFELKTYNLTIDSTEGGEVLDPGEGEIVLKGGELVDLKAVADDGYQFVEWTGDVETINDIRANETTIVMEGNYSITAHFEEEEERIGSEEWWEIPGFTTLLSIVGVVVAVAIHYKIEQIKEEY